MPDIEQQWEHVEPVDHPKHPGPTKIKSSRAGTSRKQAANQTLSCAECRRLKLRCDRVFPCSSCQKRGIAELCPEGSLPTRNKAITSSTDKEQLYQHLSELRGRVVELEKALEASHACVSSEPHPLLSEDPLMRKTLPKKRRMMPSGQVEDDENDGSEDSETLDDALGSLNVGDEGRARFFGRSACVQRLFKYQNNGAIATPQEPNILVSAEVAMIYQSFPFLTVGEATAQVQERIWRHLPPLQRAKALRRSYCRQVYYITDIVPQNGWFDELFSRVYQNSQPTDTPLVPFSESRVRMDELALLFAYFAMAALVDLELTPFNYEAEAYACLSRAALASMNILKNPTIPSIETLVLLGYFEAMWGEIIGSGDGWIITALATKLAQIIGLHRNTKKFGVEPDEVERRSRVYWEVFILELMECLSHGRPSTFSLIPSDVDMPPCTDPKHNLHAFRYRLAADCLAPLCKQMFTIKMPAYAAVVELDRKIRKVCGDYGIGQPGQGAPFSDVDESDAMRNYIKLVYRESTLLYLHRAFFVRSVAANPSDPQHTKYGLSVSGAYDCAMTLVQALGGLFQHHPALSSRALLCWNHTLCSVFILGSITTRCPGSRLAPLAAKRLHDIDELYKSASRYGGRASADSPIVSRMMDKCLEASNAYAMERNKPTRGVTKGSPGIGSEVGKGDPGDDDELALLGGHTRVIKVSKGSVSPGSSTGFAQAGYSPSQRNVSPGSTDTGSLPEPGAFPTQEHLQWEATDPGLPRYHMIVPGDDGASPPVDITDVHMSSGGSVSSSLSPEAYAPMPQETYMHSPGKPFELPQTPIEMQYRDVPGYGYSYDLPGSEYVVRSGDVRIAGDHVNLQGFQRSQQPRSDYVSMEVSTGSEAQEWNFLDNWYGHVYQLDVIPPDYGKTAA